MRYFRINVMVFMVFLSTSHAFAWGRTGHYLIADITESIMKKSVMENVQKYLGDMSFEEAANWMDEMRSEGKYDYMKP